MSEAARYFVTAVFRGDHVYVSAPIEWPSMRSRIQCSPTPTFMTAGAAERLVERVARTQSQSDPWDQLSDLRVEREDVR